jgi:hypothetical protein
VRDGHVEDEDAGRESMGWVAGSLVLRRAELPSVIRMVVLI